MSETKKLAEFAAGITYDSLPREVAERTKFLKKNW